MVKLEMDELGLLAAIEALKRVSPEQQEAAILELEGEHPGIGERIRALLALEKQTAEHIKRLEKQGREVVEPKVVVEPKKSAEVVVWVDGRQVRFPRRGFGAPALKVVEQTKPEPEPEEPEPEKVEEGRGGLVDEIVEVGNEIGRLQVKQAQLKARSEVPSDYGLGYLTPGMAAQKPIVALNELNKKHAVITNLGGKCVVMEWARSQIDDKWEEPSYQTFSAFKDRYANKYVEIILDVSGKVQKVGAEPVAGWWLAQPSRRQFDGLDLVPNGPAILRGNRLNLWRGWGVEPKEGDWSKLRHHMWVVLANEEKRSDDYIVRWITWKYQNAGEPPEVALNFKGKKGTGKGAFMYSMLKVFGPHGMEVHNPLHLTGKHNKHLQNRLLVCADEAVWAGDKQAERALKGMVTERTLTIEPKQVDMFVWPNKLGIIQSTNEKWVVPASWDERRYAVFEVNPIYMQQRKYFEALFREIDEGGAAAMLYDLLRVDLEGWHPRYDIPQTAALVDQKVQSLDGLEQWWFAKLNTGETPTPQVKNPRWVLAGKLLDEVMRHNARAKYVTEIELANFLKKVGCQHKSNGSNWGWIFPPIEEARRNWEIKFGGKCEWVRPDIREWNENCGDLMDQPMGSI